MQNLSSHETDLVAAMMKFFIVDRLVFGGVGWAFNQNDRAACGDSKGLRNGYVGPFPLVGLSYFCSSREKISRLLSISSRRSVVADRFHRRTKECCLPVGGVDCGPLELPEESRAVAIRIRWPDDPHIERGWRAGSEELSEMDT
jgi:hypothetical protein